MKILKKERISVDPNFSKLLENLKFPVFAAGININDKKGIKVGFFFKLISIIWALNEYMGMVLDKLEMYLLEIFKLLS